MSHREAILNNNASLKIEGNKKREDLQGIRGLAIVSVLLFHFYPHWFPNGFLGVDQFFVLSGFLMCMLLKKNEDQSLWTLVTTFYLRRFKRILPLYFLFIAISMVALYLFFPEMTTEINQKSATRAMFFVTNQPKKGMDNYFTMLDIAIDIFTHTWSLSAEIQFYFLVPIMFLIGNRFSPPLQYFYYGCLAFVSLFYYAVSPGSIAFNSVFARIWQFLIGMVVYLITDNRKNRKQDHEHTLLIEGEGENAEMEESQQGMPTTFERTTVFYQYFEYLILLFNVWIMSYPYAIPTFIIRPYITASTGILMCFSVDNVVLSNKLLTYIGDISYASYLIHWPIYAYWKLNMNNNQIALVLCILASVSLAIVVFETYEKWYLKLSVTSIGCLVASLVIVNVILIEKDFIRNYLIGSKNASSHFYTVTDSMTTDDAVLLNLEWTAKEELNLIVPTCEYESSDKPLGWCKHKGLASNGTYKIMTIGNSYAANHGRIVYDECHNVSNSILQGSALGCEPLQTKAGYDRDFCKLVTTDFLDRIKEYQPDYAFYIARSVWAGEPMPGNVTRVEDDPTYKTMKTNLYSMIKYVKKKIFILDAFPRVSIYRISDIAKSVKNHMNFTDIDNYLVDFDQYEMARQRYAKLIEECGDKCVRIDYVPEFYRNDTQTFRFFDDRGFSYYTAILHLTPLGLERIRHIYTDICKNL